MFDRILIPTGCGGQAANQLRKSVITEKRIVRPIIANNRQVTRFSVLLVILATSLLLQSHPVAKGNDTSSAITPEQAQAQLPKAIRDGKGEVLADLLKAGAKVNFRYSDGNTPLILAALYAQPDCVDLLIKKGADVNAVNNAGVTALIRAATNFDKARLLVEAGADVKARTHLGNTALILAARRYGNSATVKLLLKHGADPKDANPFDEARFTALWAATECGDLESVRVLADKGADVNERGIPLTLAAYRNDVPMVQFLLERKTDPNQRAIVAQAAENHCVEAVELLLKSGARVNATDRYGFTALHWASANDSPSADLVNLLLRHGADPNAAGGEANDSFLGVPQTPLMFA